MLIDTQNDGKWTKRPFDTINGIQKNMPEINIIIAEICMYVYMNEEYLIPYGPFWGKLVTNMLPYA
jgi:hypothetical protein